MAALLLHSVNRSAQITTKHCFISHKVSTLARLQDAHVASFHNSAAHRWSSLPGARWLSRGTGVRFMCQGTAGRLPAGRSRRGAALVLAGAAAAAVVGFVANAGHFQRAEMASRVIQVAKQDDDILEKCKGFMSLPVTDVKVLQEKKGEMCTRMELLIMETQAEFCRALEKVDGGKFKADRWQRKEGKSRTLAHFLAFDTLNVRWIMKPNLIVIYVCVRRRGDQLCDPGQQRV